MHEKCGVVAAIDLRIPRRRRNVAPDVRDILMRLQHRGQLSAGITSLSWDGSLKTRKDIGLVREIFKFDNIKEASRIMNNLHGSSAIGHTRYATSGNPDAELAQPFVHRGKNKRQSFAFGFNGNIANYPDLIKELANGNITLEHDVDTEILRQLFITNFQAQSTLDFADAFTNIQATLDGAFNITLLNKQGDIAAYRDKHGFRPLCYAEQDGIFYVASEDYALHTVARNVYPIKSGELITVSGKTREPKFEQIAKPDPAHCILEYVYFSHAASEFDGTPIHLSRVKSGFLLAKGENRETLDDDCIVVGIPDSGRSAARGFANGLGIPNEEGIMTNRYNTGRTFIDDPETREVRKKQKYEILRNMVKGKKVYIVDDSLIRGETLKLVIELLKKFGEPKEIHLRIGCPPISNPCFYGIDMPTTQELFVRQFGVEGISSGTLSEEKLQEIAKHLGVNSVKYLPVESLVESIGKEAGELCMACITGKYPTEAGRQTHANLSRNA